MRLDITFKTSDGLTLRGWHYLPDERTAPVPTLVMCHGFGGVKEMNLDDFGAAFAQAGFGVVVYDNRCFGDSEGEPRQEVNPWLQVSDLRDAITFAQSLPTCDPARIGVWGSSYSGGHAIVVAALDRRVKCIVAQVPLISGVENVRRFVRADMMGAVRSMLDADRQARFTGEPPGTMPLVAPTTDALAVMPTADAWAFTEQIRPHAPNFRNCVTLRSVDLFATYEPGLYTHRVSPTPMLMIVGSEDTVCAPDVAYAAYERALHPKQLVTLACGHFDPYAQCFDAAFAAARDWFAAHL
jgi:cephalosporin-C deacetylase-like acetyl esterase